MSKYCAVSLYLALAASFRLVMCFNLAAKQPTFLLTNSLHPKTLSSTRSPLTTTMKVSGGFGAGKDKDVASKIKPKGQWDRYTSMDNKTAPPVRVAVRILNEADDGEWVEVGYVKSQDNLFTEAAVARQRALIAEHAKRLYPLKILPKFKLEWGYYKEDSEEWVTVNVKEVDSSDGIERKIGFEGIADPATGFYCHYKEGRIVDKQAAPVQKPEGKVKR